MTHVSRSESLTRASAGAVPLLVAAVWGFAEATLFFVVPDVWLTWLALRSRRLALVACATSAAGAIAGGSLMHAWGARDPGRAAEILNRVPAVSPAMIEAVDRSLRRYGAVAMFAGPVTGTPYKVYAMQSGAIGAALPLFLLISIPARILRFAGLVLLTSWISQRLGDRLSDGRKRLLHLGVWVAFYIGFFLAVSS